jgi:hypothetical protein
MDDRGIQSLDPTIFSGIRQLMIGYSRTQAIYVAAKLGIADLLDKTPKSVDELAQATEARAVAETIAAYAREHRHFCRRYSR